MKVLWVLGMLLVAGVVVIQFGLGGTTPVVSIAVSFHVLAASAVAIVLGVLFIAALARRRARIRILVTFAVALSVVAAAVVSTPQTETDVPAAASGMRILEWNVVQGDVGASTMLALIKRTKPDVVVFAELYADNLPNLAGWKTPAGYTAIGPRDIAVTVLTATRLGSYTVSNADESGATSGFVAMPSTAGSPRIVASHLSRQSITGDQSGWRTGLDWVTKQCANPNAIVVGDLNTTALNLGRLGSCTFGSEAPAPSWPTSLPATFGASIDNVLTTSDWHVDSLRTLGGLDSAGSDHRPIFAVVSANSGG